MMWKNHRGHHTRPTRPTPQRPSALFWLAATILLFAALEATAQAPPATDIYLVPLEDGGRGEITRIAVHPQGKWIAFVAKAQRRM